MNIGLDLNGGVVSSCRFEGSDDGTAAVAINSQGAAPLTVTGCSFYGVPFASGAGDVALVGNTFEAAFVGTNKMVVLDGFTRSVIVGNTFDGNATDSHIVNETIMQDVAISNNKFYAGGVTLGGIGGNCNGASVIGNMFYDDGVIVFDAGVSNYILSDTVISDNNFSIETFSGVGRIEVLGSALQVRNLLIVDNLIGDGQSAVNKPMINVEYKQTNLDNGNGIKITNNMILNKANSDVSIRVSGETSKTRGTVEISNNKIFGGDGVYVEYVRDVVVSNNIVEVSTDVTFQQTYSHQFELVLCDTIVCSNNVLIGGDNADWAGTGAVLYVEATNGGSVRDNDVWGKVDGALDTAIEISGPFYVVGNRYHGTHSEYGGTAFTNEIVITGTGAVIGPNGSPVDGSGGTGVEYEAADSLIWSMSQTLTVKTGLLEIPFGVSAEIIEIEARLSIQPTGSSVIVDVNKNGTTMYTTQANRPTIATSTNTDTTTPDITAIADNDYLSVDVDQIDSNAIGQNLTVTIRFRRT